MKKVLRIVPVIYFSMEPGETQDEAEDRFLEIIDGVGLDVSSYSAAVIEEGEENEKV